MALTPISPEAARKLIDQGALLVDIRAADEHIREHIAEARHVPVEQLSRDILEIGSASAVIFHCRSGYRTQLNAQRLGACVACDAYMLEGGLNAWKRRGLPVVKDRMQPLELQRQVQITAGSLALAGSVLGVTVSPWFHLLPGFIGAGLVFAGVSGFCGLARVLMKAPWNRRTTAIAAP